MAQVMMQSSGGASDRAPFFGAKMPPEIKKLVQLSRNVDRSTYGNVLKFVVEYLQTGSDDEEALAKLETGKCTQEVLRALFAGMHIILQSALRQPKLKAEVFKEDLILIKLSPEMVTDLASAAFGSRRALLEQSLVTRSVRLPRLDSLRWRVDVTISNSVLNRVLEPSILLEMTLSDGSIKTFEVPVSRFHELRYNVAFVLKEMEDLEKRSILKLE
eukprot:Em0022g442a